MLSRFVDSRRLNAILIVTLGVTMPPAFLFGGAAASLVTLRRGGTEGVAIALGGWGAVAALLLILGGQIPASLGTMAVLLLAIVALSGVLRTTSSLAMVMMAGLGMALLSLVAFWVVVDDPTAYWHAIFANALDQYIAAGGQLSPGERDEILERLQLQAFTGNVMATFLLLVLGSVFLGRSWQARLVNPGGFRQAFHQLKLGRHFAMVTAVVFMTTAWLQPLWLLNVAAILMWVWVVQGLSVIHGMVGGLNASSGWLVATYLGLLFGWSFGIPVALVVPFLGLMNEFFDFRAYVLRNSDNGS